jgi:hypothetical protein
VEPDSEEIMIEDMNDIFIEEKEVELTKSEKKIKTYFEKGTRFIRANDM